MQNLRHVLLTGVLLTLAWGEAASAQPVRAGVELQVNTYTTGIQRAPRSAALSNGGFVVAWTDGDYGYDRTVKAQRYSAAGSPLGGEFQVNTYTTGEQRLPFVAGDHNGGFVVAWTSYHDVDSADVFGQLFDAAGNRRGSEFAVNSYTTGYQAVSGAGFDAGGNFLVVWSSVGDQDGSGASVRGQRFDAAGNRRGGEFQMNTYTTGDQVGPAVGVSPDGTFVAVWNTLDGSGRGIHGQRFGAAAAPLGSEFQVNAYTTGNQLAPRIAMDRLGRFVVVWREPDGSGDGVFGQRFDAAAAPLGTRFQVNTYTTTNQSGAAVAMDALGNFAVSWTSPTDGAFLAVAARRFSSDGTPRDPEFVANDFTTGGQHTASLSSDDAGNVLVVYTDSGRDGDGEGIFAQRFGGLRPAALAADPAGNGVLQPDEDSELRPSWHNVNGGPLTFAGALGSFSGPAGGTYAVIDGTADYGTLADGATGPCSGCYFVRVSAPIRPALHWDASVVEAITPDALGQRKLWRLHVGASFADVALSSPFYRFIETLLHRSVTGGCSGTNYCPASGTTREQMAVFVLVAREGAGYVPPACTSPVFSDVPASSPFCRYVEELARRGVVSGCGGGNYCPASAVTREQLAVFVLRTLDPTLNPPACVPPNIFGDVPETSLFCRWIEELSRRGVVSGCGGGNYCPAQPVTRQEMAVFLVVTFGLTLYGP